MRKRSKYERLGEAGGFTVCSDVHNVGHLEPNSFHVPRKRFTRRGAYELLRVVYEHPDRQAARPMLLEAWERRWDRIRWMQDVMRRAGLGAFNLPTAVMEEERAKLRAELSDYVTRVPAYARPEAYDRAQRWSERRRPIHDER